MPYKSKAQQKFFHQALKEGKISKETVDKWDSESRGKKLPKKAPKKGPSKIGKIKEIK